MSGAVSQQAHLHRTYLHQTSATTPLKRLITAGVALGLVVTIDACSNAITTASEESRSAVAEWKGKNRVELASQAGVSPRKRCP